MLRVQAAQLSRTRTGKLVTPIARLCGYNKNVRWYSTPKPPRQISSSPSKGQKELGSHIQTKLDYFIKSGEILDYTWAEYNKILVDQRQSSRSSKNISEKQVINRALIILKSKYAECMIQDQDGNVIDVEKLTQRDLSLASDTSLVIFNHLGLFEKYKYDKTSLEALTRALLGVNEATVDDSYAVTWRCLKLLERDESIERAVKLARMARSNGVVAMNSIMQWQLERGDIDGAMRLLNDRAKWLVIPNSQTFLILFNGIANSSEWGKVSNGLANTVVEIFDKWRSRVTFKNTETKPVELTIAEAIRPPQVKRKLKTPTHTKFIHESHLEPFRITASGRKVIRGPRCDVDHFNAALSALVKNYTNDQEYTWAFFDRLIPDQNSTDETIVANSQTFTIFLQGIKKYNQHRAGLIRNDRDMSATAKALALLKNQAKLIQIANLIMEKALKAAIPPEVPDLKDVVENNAPFKKYRSALEIPVLNIDAPLVSVFLSCFINNFSGTGIDVNAGSHYIYNQHALRYLKIWCPEVDQIFEFISTKNGYEGSNVKDITNSRIEKVIEKFKKSDLEMEEAIEDILPSNVLPQERLTKELLNPMVRLPPTRIKSGDFVTAIERIKPTPLVDFTRVTVAESSKYLLRNKLQYMTTSDFDTFGRDPINKFILTHVFDALLNLGQKREFVIALWFVLQKWGGIKLSENELAKLSNDSCLVDGILDIESYPNLSQQLEVSKKRDNRVNENVIDMVLIEKFIFIINENFKSQGKSSSRIIVEVLSALVNPKLNIFKVLQPRLKTIDVIFSSLNTDLHYYNDFNQNVLILEKNAGKFPNNPPKLSISHEQLEIFLKTLNRFMDTLHVYESKFAKKAYLLPNNFINSFNKIVDRIHSSTWLHINEEQRLQHHKSIVKAGISTYKPQSLIDFSENLQFTVSIYRSLKYIGDKIKDDKSQVKLFNALRLMSNLDRKDPDAKAKLKSYTDTIYRYVEDTKLGGSEETETNSGTKTVSEESLVLPGAPLLDS